MIIVRNINLNHSRDASDELVKRAEDLGSAQYIFFVQEPYCFNGNVAGLGGAGKVLYFRKDPKPVRSCIVCSKGVNVWLIDDLSDNDNTICAIKLDGNLTYIASCYFDITKSIINNPMNNIIGDINSKNIPLLINCDSNSHSTIWGSTDNMPGVMSLKNSSSLIT